MHYVPKASKCAIQQYWALFHEITVCDYKQLLTITILSLPTLNGSRTEYLAQNKPLPSSIVRTPHACTIILLEVAQRTFNAQVAPQYVAMFVEITYCLAWPTSITLLVMPTYYRP